MTEPPAGPPSSGAPDWNEMKGKLTAAKGADRLILIAGGLFLVDSFLPWYGVGLGGFSLNIKGWSAGGLAVTAILCAIACTALAVTQLLGVGGLKATGTMYLGLGAGAFVFALLRFITESRLTKFGLYVAIALGAVLAYGGWQKKQAEKKVA